MNNEEKQTMEERFNNQINVGTIFEDDCYCGGGYNHQVEKILKIKAFIRQEIAQAVQEAKREMVERLKKWDKEKWDMEVHCPCLSHYTDKLEKELKALSTHPKIKVTITREAAKKLGVEDLLSPSKDEPERGK